MKLTLDTYCTILLLHIRARITFSLHKYTIKPFYQCIVNVEKQPRGERRPLTNARAQKNVNAFPHFNSPSYN